MLPSRWCHGLKARVQPQMLYRAEAFKAHGNDGPRAHQALSRQRIAEESYHLEGQASHAHHGLRPANAQGRR